MAGIDSVFVREFRESWSRLAIAFACMMFAFSAPLIALPFLYGPIMDEFGWTREQVTLLASAKFAVGAVTSLVVGKFVDVIGVRKMLIFVSTAGGLAMVSFLWTPNLALYYGAGILLGIAAPGTIVAVKVLVSRTFHASQGTAMGLVMLGTSVASVIVPFVLTALIEMHGWRIAIAALSIGIWFLTLPMLVWGCSDRSLGHSPAVTDRAQPFDWGELRQFMQKRDFWLIAVAVMMAGFVDQAFMQHQVLYLTLDMGMSATFVASVVSIFGAIGIIGRIVVGGVFDKASVKGVSAMYLVLAAGCLFALGVLNPYLLAAFVIFRAVGHSAVLLDTTILTKHVFGLANIGVLLGIYTALINVGFALGPWVVARMYASNGSYAQAFVMCAVLAVVAAAILLPVKPAYWLDMRERMRSGRAAVSSD